MDELRWPVVKCESCNFDLREVDPKAGDKTNDVSGRLTWHDHCPKCGHGYQVGFRTPPDRPKVEGIDGPTLNYVTDQALEKAKPSENPDPEGLISKTAVAVMERPEPEAIKPPGEGEYFCTKCAKNHREKSRLGARHLKYKE